MPNKSAAGTLGDLALELHHGVIEMAQLQTWAEAFPENVPTLTYSRINHIREVFATCEWRVLTMFRSLGLDFPEPIAECLKDKDLDSYFMALTGAFGPGKREGV